MLEAVQLMKDGYPIRILFKEFVNRYGHLVEKGITFPDDRECCAAVLNKTFGDSSSLYQIGISKVFLKDQSREVLRKKWEEVQSLAALTLQKNLRGFLNRKNFQVYRRKITVVQAHIRGRQARHYFSYQNSSAAAESLGLILHLPGRLIHDIALETIVMNDQAGL
ncbi:uncharacterized protein [Aquarana catesbeiana]|uniref:uncharacterized protein n=1 Tax=Aquarana catesbeiana TaxID=8400 RepID=UPI003CCA2CF5